VVLWPLVSSVLLCGVLCAATCMGIGAFVGKWFAAEAGAVEAFWLGLCAVVTLLELYHLLRPIDAAIGLALLIIGLLGFIANGLPAQLLQEIRRTGPWTSSIYAAALAVIALRSATPCKFYDTGLYGAQAIRWMATYPVVPGLANLQGRLGFNSSVLLCMAVLRHGVFMPLTYRVFDGLALAMLLAPVMAAGVRLVGGRSNSSTDWFAAILTLPLLYRIFESSETADLVGTDTDLPAMVVCLAAIGYLFSALQANGSSPDEPTVGEQAASVRSSLVCADALFALAAVFKLSMIVLAGAGWLLAFNKWQSLQPARKPRRLDWLGFVGIPAAIVVPWIAQGLILSGYPFYPSSLFGIPVEWRVPASSVRLVAAGVRSWARMPHATLSESAGVHWIGVWFHGVRADRAEFLFPVLITIAGSLLILWEETQKPSGWNFPGVWLLIPIFLALVFWIVQAPALRFAQAPLWGMACILGGYGISRFVETHPMINRFATARFLIAAILMAAAWSLYLHTLWQRSFSTLTEVRQFSALPLPDVKPMETLYGVRVYVPRLGNTWWDGSRTHGGQTWDSPLPSSPYLNETLRMRQPGDLGSGFTSDGLPQYAEWNSSRSPSSNSAP
jgi:hypothetical protein